MQYRKFDIYIKKKKEINYNLPWRREIRDSRGSDLSTFVRKAVSWGLRHSYRRNRSRDILRRIQLVESRTQLIFQTVLINESMNIFNDPYAVRLRSCKWYKNIT